MTSSQSPTKTRKTKIIDTDRGTRSIQLTRSVQTVSATARSRVGVDVAHRKASLSSRPRMRSTSAPKRGVVIMSSVRGRGRSIGTASAMRPGRGAST